MITSNNSTEYGIHNTGERCFWIIYLLIVLLSSLIGDSIILLASLRYNAIKLHGLLVAVMQHIAACDLLAALSYTLPTLTSLITNTWVFGETLGYLHLYFNVYSVQASTIFMCVLTTGKLLLLKFPVKTRGWGGRGAHCICILVWVTAHVYPAIRFFLDQHGLVFSYVSYNLDFGTSANSPQHVKTLIRVVSMVIFYLPVLIVLVTTLPTLHYLIKARRISENAGKTARWQGIVTVVVTSAVFCITSVSERVGVMVITLSTEGVSGSDRTGFKRVSEFLSALNFMSNFYIYTITIPSFRRFVRSKAFKLSRKASRMIVMSRAERNRLALMEVRQGQSETPQCTMESRLQTEI